MVARLTSLSKEAEAAGNENPIKTFLGAATLTPEGKISWCHAHRMTIIGTTVLLTREVECSC